MSKKSYQEKPREEWTPEDHAERNADNDPILKLRQENEELKEENQRLKSKNKKSREKSEKK